MFFFCFLISYVPYCTLYKQSDRSNGWHSFSTDLTVRHIFCAGCFLIYFLELSLAVKMEADHGSMAVTVSFAALTCAGETLATMFLSALVKTHLLALVTQILINFVSLFLVLFHFVFLWFLPYMLSCAVKPSFLRLFIGCSRVLLFVFLFLFEVYLFL